MFLVNKTIRINDKTLNKEIIILTKDIKEIYKGLNNAFHLKLCYKLFYGHISLLNEKDNM